QNISYLCECISNKLGVRKVSLLVIQINSEPKVKARSQDPEGRYVFEPITSPLMKEISSLLSNLLIPDENSEIYYPSRVLQAKFPKSES
ncbi:hypothetical protein CDAR_419351, partial [Caerostris darwini]